jgi:hypothetical protein
MARVLTKAKERLTYAELLIKIRWSSKPYDVKVSSTVLAGGERRESDFYPTHRTMLIL